MNDIFIMDMGGHDDNVNALLERWPHAQVTRWYGSHLETITRCMEKCRTTHAWILSSCCDYSINFDINWLHEIGQEKQIHCWASDDQKQGDTFWIPQSEWAAQQPLEKLEWFRDINYHNNGAENIPRLIWPIIKFKDINITSAIQQYDFISPYAWFVPETVTEVGTGSMPSLWAENTRQLVSFSTDNSINLVPREAKSYLKKQIYDYPYLHRFTRFNETEQDIVFISYDETDANYAYNRLTTKFPRAKRVHGVEGMENALKAAAELSTTPWFYAVFAKTELAKEWQFNYSPDYWQGAKHYIFYAKNMSNDLVYGEMGVIMYHRQTVLDAPAWEDLGLDFTMSFDTVVVPELSAYGKFATDPYRAWRTAFRETCKLAAWNDETYCVETEYRLNEWMTNAHGDHRDWVLAGAKDGYNYYRHYKGNMPALKQTFRWDWLKKYFLERYPAMKSSTADAM